MTVGQLLLLAGMGVRLAALPAPTQSPPAPSQLPPAPSQSPPAPSTYVPNRVYDTRSKTFSDFEMMVAAIAKADVVFVGEQHDDPNTHRIEAAILEGLLRRKVVPTVSLEMFERDVQGTLDGYVAGRLTEEELRKASRPWPRYATDYRPLVELARQHGWRVIAANVPRRLASAVGKSGTDALGELPDTDRPLVARDLECPRDDYYNRFAASMSSHPSTAQTAEKKTAMTDRFYWAQCVKDETMAESIVSALEKNSGVIVHYNGAFHSDFGLGTAARVRRRAPDARIVIVSVLPIADLDVVTPSEEDLKRADFLVYTTR